MKNQPVIQYHITVSSNGLVLHFFFLLCETHQVEGECRMVLRRHPTLQPQRKWIYGWSVYSLSVLWCVTPLWRACFVDRKRQKVLSRRRHCGLRIDDHHPYTHSWSTVWLCLTIVYLTVVRTFFTISFKLEYMSIPILWVAMPSLHDEMGRVGYGVKECAIRIHSTIIPYFEFHTNGHHQGNESIFYVYVRYCAGPLVIAVFSLVEKKTSFICGNCV